MDENLNRSGGRYRVRKRETLSPETENTDGTRASAAVTTLSVTRSRILEEESKQAVDNTDGTRASAAVTTLSVTPASDESLTALRKLFLTEQIRELGRRNRYKNQLLTRRKQRLLEFALKRGKDSDRQSVEAEMHRDKQESEDLHMLKSMVQDLNNSVEEMQSIVPDFVVIPVDAKEVDIQYDMIIGRDAIIEHNLLQFDSEFRSLFSTEMSLHGHPTELVINPGEIVDKCITCNNSTGPAEPLGTETNERILQVTTGTREVEELNVLKGLLEQVQMRDLAEPIMMNRAKENFQTAKLMTLREPKNGRLGMSADLASSSNTNVALSDHRFSLQAQSDIHPKPSQPELNRAHMSQYIHYEATAEGEEISRSEDPKYHWEYDLSSGSLVERSASSDIQAGTNLPPNIFGDDSFREETKALCTKYSDIFSTRLRREPADLPPMELKVDLAKWQVSSNSGPPRHQTGLKQVETKQQVEKLLAAEAIQTSQAAFYSQVHLVPKPHGKWRFCVDFRYLNLASKGMGWPIPNIQQMLQRLGQQRSKFYGKMDLTSGYHQAPMHPNSRAYTSFITFMGVFEWLRVPMGLKGAPSHFQGILASIVLIGLIYVICELYLDDIIVHGKTKEEFLFRLEEIFKRFKKHRLIANPDKCFFGMKDVEFVGHTINEEGMSFSREKIEKVLCIPEPVFGKEMKSFLGVAGYFRDHIANYATVVRPLQKMIDNYERNRKLVWSEEGRVSFHAIKQAINDCPTLFFLDDCSPIFMHTDASDYGIGAYLFQVVDGKERPVAFMSKMLSDTEMRWNTTEKEAYAIVYAFKKFEYLVRDRSFTLRTDHKNLIYVDSDTSAKVKRWKLMIQEYDFFIEHIEGKKNIVADGFSRLLPIKMEHLHLLETFTLSQDIYNKIAEVHNGTCGHHGVERTMRMLARQNKHWKYQREHVKRFIKQCPCCQKMSYLKTQIHTHPFTVAAYEPMERLEMDTIGPLPADENGNRYILVIICCFTRWVSLYPVKDTTAKECLPAVLKHVGTFGVPCQILTDNGTQFVNEVIEELFKIIGTQHLTILPYSKEENAIVERANKEVMRHLRGMIFAHNEIAQWSDHYVPLVQRIMNTYRSSSNEAVPAQLLFGNAINLDRGIFLPQTAITDNRIALSDWAGKMLSTQDYFIKQAERQQRRKDELHIEKADPRRTVYNNGDYVLVEYQSNSIMPRKAPNKFLPNLRGPFRVIGRDQDRYTLQNCLTETIEEIHLKKIHPFFYDATYTSPREVAMRDVLTLFDVESILEHSGDRKKRSELDFLVKFRGWSEEYNLWLPYSELRDNAALHEYLIAHRMRSLIPEKFREQYRHQ